MKLIITDTNVFFDIINIQALPEFFSLDYEICTTDFVLNEILFSNQKNQIDPFIRVRKLTVFSFTAEEIEEINIMKTKRNLRVLTDKTVLWKSIKLKCPVLTGDLKLRKEAEDFGLSVYGSIWVIETLIKSKKIPNEAGIIFLERLKVTNESLPHDEIDKLIVKYKN
jgi:rRNA-processing protein FCF1